MYESLYFSSGSVRSVVKNIWFAWLNLRPVQLDANMGCVHEAGMLSISDQRNKISDRFWITSWSGDAPGWPWGDFHLSEWQSTLTRITVLQMECTLFWRTSRVQVLWVLQNGRSHLMNDYVCDIAVSAARRKSLYPELLVFAVLSITWNVFD